MADVSIRDDALHIALSVPERVLSLQTGPIDVPLAKITKAIAVPDALDHVRGQRMVGAGAGGVPAIGTWHGDQAGRRFRDLVVVHRHGPGVVLTLENGEFDRIVLATARPDDLLAELQ